ncbi:hypothetical protein ACWGDS_48680 [Streptomyces sp. NPDC055059]|jgi:hypothetical protein|uniref:hypothetical protein n=1 Tax=unclassified Streptomyces TaxID=2593676 RepID=UPI00325685B9
MTAVSMVVRVAMQGDEGGVVVEASAVDVVEQRFGAARVPPSDPRLQGVEAA